MGWSYNITFGFCNRGTNSCVFCFLFFLYCLFLSTNKLLPIFPGIMWKPQEANVILWCSNKLKKLEGTIQVVSTSIIDLRNFDGFKRREIKTFFAYTHEKLWKCSFHILICTTRWLYLQFGECTHSLDSVKKYPLIHQPLSYFLTDKEYWES